MGDSWVILDSHEGKRILILVVMLVGLMLVVTICFTGFQYLSAAENCARLLKEIEKVNQSHWENSLLLVSAMIFTVDMGALFGPWVPEK